MCLIIRKPAGRRICPQFLENAWQRNADGWGSLQLLGGGPRGKKGLKLDELLAHNASLPTAEEAYLHLRKATHGEINHEMAHPYVVREGLLLMHNGQIHPLAPADKRLSDTFELARLLRSLLEGLNDTQAAALLRSEGFARLTAPLVEGSMVVLLDAQGAVRLGRDWHPVARHEWDDAVMHGIEVSNTHAWAPRAPVPARHHPAAMAPRQHWLGPFGQMQPG